MNTGAGNNDFEELEPRITPQPTLLKCMTAPSVPEVSMIFGKHPGATQDFKEFRTTPVKQYETYANWRKDEYPPSILPKVDSPYVRQSFDKTANNGSLVPRRSTFDDSQNFIVIPVDKNISGNSLENQRNVRTNENKIVPIRQNNNENLTTNPIVDNARYRNYENHSQNQIAGYPSSTSKIVDSPSQRRSHDGVKSILKSSILERTEFSNQSPSVDCRLKKKYGSHVRSQSPGNLVVSEYSRSSSSRSRNRHVDGDNDRETVRDLLLLVKNQNEQIKSLQNQVERLLKAHEESLGCRESRTTVTNKSSETRALPTYVDDDKSFPSNSHSPQKMCNSRGTKIVGAFASDDTPELRLLYQNDQIQRNTIVEKKVSIGVMTSFEFSVHNNPFVGDSENSVNAVFRECGKNMTDTAENWRTNMCSRNIVPGPLENINEDSEGYPSSLWKQSNNTTQSSSMEKSNSKRIPTINGNKNYNENSNRREVVLENSKTGTDGEENFPNRSSQPPIPAPRRSLSNCRKERNDSEVSERRIRDFGDFRNTEFNDVREREFYDSRRAENENASDRENGEIREDLYSAENDRFTRDSEISKSRIKSTRMENPDEGSLVLSSSDLRVVERPPSPDPSIHVEMREYSSDDDDEKSKVVPPVGWTFYKNIVGQVNRILHTIPDTKDLEVEEINDSPDVRSDNDGREDAVDSVKLATLERLKMLGISYAEHSEFTGEHVQKKVTFDSSYCPRLDYQTTLPQPTNNVAESNTSMHMKALALKYLSDEQLAELAVQKQGDGSGMNHKLLNSVHATNMSLATMNYLQRYCMVSGGNNSPAEGKEHINAIRQKKLKQVVMTKEVHAQPMQRHQNFNNSATKKGPDNILDITTLKQQPKLL